MSHSLGDRIVATLPRKPLVEPSVHQRALDDANLTHLAIGRYLHSLAKRLSPEEYVAFLLEKGYPNSPGNARVYYAPKETT
jgi:hypothetical protein